jgi:hypothetical protein
VRAIWLYLRTFAEAVRNGQLSGVSIGDASPLALPRSLFGAGVLTSFTPCIIR